MVLPSLKFSGLAIRCLVAAVPALVLVIFAGLFRTDGREYVLALTEKLTDLARVLMGAPVPPGADPPAVEVGPHDAKAPPDAPAAAPRVPRYRIGS